MSTEHRTCFVFGLFEMSGWNDICFIYLKMHDKIDSFECRYGIYGIFMIQLFQLSRTL